VLAAVARAVLHRADAAQAAPLWSILAHLALARRSGAARSVEQRLAALVDAGELTRLRRRGANVWALTRQGEEHLRQARAQELAPLPESPQHRAWRTARVAAGEEIEGFRQRLRVLLDDAERQLVSERAGDSDAWLVLGEELQRACRLLASATHCLYEWREPDDAVADIDDRDAPTSHGPSTGATEIDPRGLARLRALRAGRRNVRLWHEHDER
jgi:hypothetical protein